jgi:hypothetical protein
MVSLGVLINGVSLPTDPYAFTVTIADIDDEEKATRTADATLNRARIASKRTINVAFRPLKWAAVSEILTMIKDEFFECTYPDPQDGVYLTKTFYVGNRPSAVAILTNDGEMYWDGIEFTMVER